MHNHEFQVGDRVRSIGNITKRYGAGKITEINKDVATVKFNLDGRIEPFNVQMLKKV